jgi:transcriptional regulator with XRE-family HTH domain
MPTREELGKRIKAARTEKGLTLKEVELLSGVSMTHTSQIERGMTSPTIGALEKLARALDKTTSFFIEDNILDEVCHLPKSERNVLVNEKTGLRLEGLTNGIAGGTIHYYHLTATPILQEPRKKSHPGEEAIVVTRGSLDVQVGDAQYRLKSGDSIHFKSSKPHSLHAATRTGAEAIWIGTSAPVL